MTCVDDFSGHHDIQWSSEENVAVNLFKIYSILNMVSIPPLLLYISMGYCKKDVTPLLMHLSYAFLALTHRYTNSVPLYIWLYSEQSTWHGFPARKVDMLDFKRLPHLYMPNITIEAASNLPAQSG